MVIIVEAMLFFIGIEIRQITAPNAAYIENPLIIFAMYTLVNVFVCDLKKPM